MNLEELKIFENCEIGSTSPFYRNLEKKVPFIGFDDSGWFETEEYYLLEIDRDGDAKIIDSGVIKERLEAKAEKYNELAQKDKEFYWKTVRSIYARFQHDIQSAYFICKSLNDFQDVFENFTHKHLKTIDEKILPKFLKFVSLDKGYLELKPFFELKYEVKTIEKGFYDYDKETENNSRLEN